MARPIVAALDRLTDALARATAVAIDRRPCPPAMPVTAVGLARYDHFDPALASVAAWRTAGVAPSAHAAAQDVVRRAAPLVGRALDRAAYGAPLPDAAYGDVRPTPGGTR